MTRNAIMYISLGFTQPCLLQILSLRQVPDSALEMVVYDGTVYAGALFSKHKVIFLRFSLPDSKKLIKLR